MSKIFTKGNNFVRQLGIGDAPKSGEWARVKVEGFEVKVRKVEANTGQTAILTNSGIICS